MCHISEGPSNAVWDLMNSTRNHSPNPVSEKLSNYQKMPENVGDVNDSGSNQYQRIHKYDFL